MTLTGLPNPFGADFVKDPWQAVPGHVPEVQRAALERWKQLIDQVEKSGVSASLMVYGEAGSGKTHLLSQVREGYVAAARPAPLVWAKQETSVSQIWRNLRRCLFRDLLRTTGNGPTALDCLLSGRFPGWTPAGVGREGIAGVIFGRTPAYQVLARLLDDMDRTKRPDRATRAVLAKLYDPASASAARDWLYGEELEPEALTALGLPATGLADADREQQSREVVKSICRLTAANSPLCICFDQVEGLQAGTNDTASLVDFSKVAFELVEEPSAAVLVVTLIQPHVLQALEATAHQAYIHRIKQHVANIPSLSWEQAVAVALARLEAVEVVRRERHQHQDKYWPVGEGFVRKLYDGNAYSLTPRHLIRACRDEFARLQHGSAGPVVPARGGNAGDTSTGGPGQPPADDLAAGWLTARNNFLAKPQSVQFDRVIEIGLPFLIELTQTPLVRIKDANPALGDVSLLFQPTDGGRKPIGVSCCNHDPRSLWRRLDRLLDQWMATSGKSLGTLVVVRSAVPPPTPAAQTRLDTLAKAGVRVLLVDHTPLASLAAYQLMLTSAHNGKLARGGKTVEVSEYTAWAKSHQSEAALTFFEQVFAPVPPPGRPEVQPEVTAPSGKKAAAKATVRTRK